MQHRWSSRKTWQNSILSTIINFRIGYFHFFFLFVTQFTTLKSIICIVSHPKETLNISLLFVFFLCANAKNQTILNTCIRSLIQYYYYYCYSAEGTTISQGVEIIKSQIKLKNLPMLRFGIHAILFARDQRLVPHAIDASVQSSHIRWYYLQLYIFISLWLCTAFCTWSHKTVGLCKRSQHLGTNRSCELCTHNILKPIRFMCARFHVPVI